jgi:hypothetical protein
VIQPDAPECFKKSNVMVGMPLQTTSASLVAIDDYILLDEQLKDTIDQDYKVNGIKICWDSAFNLKSI